MQKYTDPGVNLKGHFEGASKPPLGPKAIFLQFKKFQWYIDPAQSAVAGQSASDDLAPPVRLMHTFSFC